MATARIPAPTEVYPLSLVSYPPDRKAAIIEALQKATEGHGELTPDGAKAFAEGDLPADVDYYDTESERDAARKVLEATGAVVSAPPPHPSLAVRALVDELGEAIGASKDPALGDIFDRLTDAIWQAPTEAQSVPNAFEELDSIQEDLLGLVHHFRLADQKLYDLLDGVPEEFQPAAFVLHDATEALDELHNRLDRLNIRMADLRRGPGWRERLKAEMQDAPAAEGSQS